MYILGLTGSIGMGKSFVAKEFRRLGIPVFDADQAVHGLFAHSDKVKTAISSHFPEVMGEGGIDRKALSAKVFHNQAGLAMLEALLHPLVFEEQQRFLAAHRRRGIKIVVLEIPLLFEKKREMLCDAVVVVTASPFAQKRRVMRRERMTEEKLRDILRIQLHDTKKRQNADFIIYTGFGKGDTKRAVRGIINQFLRKKRANHAGNCRRHGNHGA